MKDSNYAEVVVHEIYHYFDRLLTGGEERYSEEKKIAQFIDTNLDDERYTKKKIMALMLFANNKGKLENEVVDELYDEWMNNRKYFVSEPELFARYKTLKHQNGVTLLEQDMQSSQKQPNRKWVAKSHFSEPTKTGF